MVSVSLILWRVGIFLLTAIALALIYCLWRRIWAPRVQIIKNRKIAPRMNVLATALTEVPYRPVWYLPHPYMKLWINTRMKTSTVYESELIRVGKDVDICACWHPNKPASGEYLAGDIRVNPEVVLVLVPGFGSSQRSWYLAQAAELSFKEYGWRSVVYNKPGYGQRDLPNNGEERYYLHRHDFLEQFVRKVKADSGAKHVVLMGHSQGGMMAYMAAGKLSHLLAAVVSVSPVFDAITTYSKVDSTYRGKDRRLQACKDEVSRWIKLSPEKWQNLGIDMELVNSIKTNKEYDEKIVCRTAGLSSLGEYYERITDLSVLLQVRSPTLIISSGDDMIIDNDTLKEDIKRNVCTNQNIIWAHYNDGGHIEFPMIRSAQKGIECWANIAGLKFLKLALETAES